MKTLIINGSPNGRKGNSEIFCRRFIKSMHNQPEIRYAVEEDPAALAAEMDRYDHWLFFFPLYVNAMPGILKRLFEHLKPNEEKKAGYFIQSGFEEAFQSDWLCAILRNFNRRMGYGDLGIVVAGGMAGVRYMPERMNKKIFARLEEAGSLYEESGVLNQETIRQFGRLHKYNKNQLRRIGLFKKLGLTDLFWNSMLKKNNAYARRFDKPFAPPKKESRNKMKTCNIINFLGVCIILFVCLFGCAASKEPSGNITSSPSTETAIIEADTAVDLQQQESANLVDERFELLSLVFRLAGREEYSDVNTEYQERLVSEFGGYKEHKAVQYAKKLPLGYDAVFNFSVHIQKNGEQFVFIDDIGSLVKDGRWTSQSAADFLERLNVFYTETGFAAFYQANMDFYKAETQHFIDSTYSEIDLEWFGAYVNSDNLRCIYSPSSTQHNYGATVNDTIVYCAVSGAGNVIVHEYCHSFANSIAHKWYEENPEFKKWCDDTIDPVKLPSYGNGQTIAGEYVTRAYNTLYYAEHGYALPPLFYGEKGQGFPYIEEVYSMITPYEKPDVGGDKIESILGVPYEMGQEQSYAIGSRQLRWQVLSLSKPLALIFQPTEVGNVFGSSTGDVLYVEDTGEQTPYLLIDLGEATFQGKDGYREYSRVPME